MPKFFALNGDLIAEPDPSSGITVIEAEDWKDVLDKLNLDSRDEEEYTPSEDETKIDVGRIAEEFGIDGFTEDATLEVVDVRKLQDRFHEMVLNWENPYVVEQVYKFLFNLESVDEGVKHA